MHGSYTQYQLLILFDVVTKKKAPNSIEKALLARLDFYKFLRTLNSSWLNTTCIYAATGNLELLRYAHNDNCPLDKQTCKNAAYYAAHYRHKNDHMDCLLYVVNNGSNVIDDDGYIRSQYHIKNDYYAYVSPDRKTIVVNYKS